jgi:hypothetical protein
MWSCGPLLQNLTTQADQWGKLCRRIKHLKISCPGIKLQPSPFSLRGWPKLEKVQNIPPTYRPNINKQVVDTKDTSLTGRSDTIMLEILIGEYKLK